MTIEAGEYRLRHLLENPFTWARDGQRFAYDPVNNMIHATGGWRDTGGTFETTNEHYTINPVTNVVTQLANAPWNTTHTHCFTYMNGKFYKWAYDNTTTTYDKTLWSYDSVNGWVQVLADCGLTVAPQGMFYGTDGEYIICGGGGYGDFSYDTSNAPYANIWHWKPGMTAFAKIADFTLPEMDGTNHTGLEHGSFMVFKGAWYIRGGGKYWRASGIGSHALPIYVNPYVFKSTDGGHTWTIAATVEGSYWCSMFCTADTAFFLTANTGGDSEMRQGIELSSDGITWMKMPYSAGKRHAVSACCTNTDFFFGCGSGEMTFNDLWTVKKII